MKPLLSYYGGKQRIASRIVEEIKQILHACYVEPFCGGAAVLFAKDHPKLSANNDRAIEVINDTSDLLISFYRVAVSRESDLFEMLNATAYSQSEYAKAKAILKDSSSYDALTLAWAYYLAASWGYANKVGGGWQRSPINNHASLHQNRLSRFREQVDRIKNVEIYNADALQIIKEMDSPTTLFYCDPPYVNTSQGHYTGYTIEDLQALCDMLDSISGSYILSGYDNTDIIPKSVTRTVKIEAYSSASTKKGSRKDIVTANGLSLYRHECLWIGDRSTKQELPLLQLMAS